jgi:hypothetical protein
VEEHGDALTQARRAYAAGEWSTAAARYDSVADEQLTAYDLAAYFEAMWWLGRSEDALRVGAAAYEALLADSRPVEAVRLAMLVVLTHLARGDEPQAHGWAGRARRARKPAQQPVGGLGCPRAARPARGLPGLVETTQRAGTAARGP